MGAVLDETSIIFCLVQKSYDVGHSHLGPKFLYDPYILTILVYALFENEVS